MPPFALALLVAFAAGFVVSQIATFGTMMGGLLLIFIGVMCFLYCLNILDRGNVGIARVTTMEKDLEVNRELFDLCIGFFYIGYLLFEVPSNLLLRRFGAREPACLEPA